MAAVNTVWGGITNFLTDAWTFISSSFTALMEKINTVALPCLKDSLALSVDTVKELDARDWTVLGIGAGVAAAVTSVACACLCKAKA